MKTPALLKKPARTSSPDFHAAMKPHGLLRKLDAYAHTAAGGDKEHHEATVSLISRLSSVKRHLALVADVQFNPSIDADLAALARLL